MQQELLASLRRLYGPNNTRTIEAEERFAVTLMNRNTDDAENILSALETLSRVMDAKQRHFGSHSPETLQTVGQLAQGKMVFADRYIQGDARERMLGEAEWLFKDSLEIWRRLRGEAEIHFLETSAMLVQVLIMRNKVDEARAIYTHIKPLILRVLGPEHHLCHQLSEVASHYQTTRGIEL